MSIAMAALLLVAKSGTCQTNIFPSSGSAGIGTTTPNVSSLLEMVSSSKGLLIPRMTMAQRNAIASPATGLLIFQINSTPGFYFYTGSAWAPLSVPAGANKSLSNLTTTSINQSLLPAANSTIGLGDATHLWNTLWVAGDANIAGVAIGKGTGTGPGNISMGYNCLNNNTTGNGNVAIGTTALISNTTGYSNIALGSASSQGNTSGGANIAVGYNALFANSAGNRNVAIGTNTLYTNQQSYNTAVGDEAAYYNTTGGNLTALGSNALHYNTIGNNNTAIGVSALTFNTSGSGNSALGLQALLNNTTGINNTASGVSSLSQNNTGSTNVAIGYEALYSNISGNGNTAVGTYAGKYNTAYSNTTALGFAASVSADNQVRVGNTSVTSIGGQVGWTTLSDERVKKNIKENVPGLAFINKLKPVTYNYDLDAELKITKANTDGNDVLAAGRAIASKKVFTGFLAQEVEKAAVSLGYDFSGVDAAKNDQDLYGLRYAEFVVPIVKAVQELSTQNDAMKSEIGNLKSENDDLQKRIEKLEAMMRNQVSGASENRSTVNSQLSTASLEQNVPNPFNGSTTISYILPDTYTSAEIVIIDKAGRSIKRINLSGKGKGSITVDMATVSSGTYICTLYVNNKVVESRQMIMQK